MTSMQLPKIEADGSKKITTLLSWLRDGSLRVPRFQWDFVWERGKIVDLLDSIYKEYPIGSFFLWETSGKTNLFYRDLPELGIKPPRPKEDDKIKFILDGQQRICSLYAVWNGLRVEFKYGATTKVVDCTQICLDLDYYKKEPDEDGNISVFEIRRESDRYVPFHKVVGGNHLQVLLALTPERQKIFQRCYETFSSYPLSVVTVTGVELHTASTIFERINQGGKKLSLFDLVVASTWAEDFDLKNNYYELCEKLGRKGYGDISPEVLTQTLALILKGNCTKTQQLQLKTHDIQENWTKVVSAIELAIDHLSANFGVKVYEFIPYPAFIPLLAYLFYKHKSRSLTNKMTEVVHEWFWKASLSERYAASTATRMSEDRKAIFDRLLQGNEVKISYVLTADRDKIATTTIGTKSALRNAVLCLLALRNLRHFTSGTAISLGNEYFSNFNSPEKHHVFPRSFLQKKGIGKENLLANFCFISAELNKEISDQQPSQYFARYHHANPEFDTALQSHLLEYSDSIRQDDYQQFIKDRSVALEREFERLTGSRIIQVLGVNANLALDEIEQKLRLLINTQLREKVGENYWKEVVPGDIQERVQKKISEYLRKNPGVNEHQLDAYDRLCRCDIMDYSGIILKNWSHFEKFFRMKQESENRFVKLKDFRNAVKHAREINVVLQHDGEAAVEWFSQVLRGVSGDDENEEEAEVKVTLPPETEDKTIARVKSEFVKKAVKLIPQWIDKDYPNGNVYISKGNAGSYHSIKRGDDLILFYYYANHWVYMELQSTTPEELQKLKEKLSNSESILDRGNRYGQVRFKLFNENDLSVAQEIVNSRIEKF